MSTQDDEDLKLKPPEVQTPAPRPAPEPPADTQPVSPAPGESRAGDLEPGAGKPLVEGPPMSVGEPIPEQTINRTATIAGIGLLGIGLILAVALLLVIVFALCIHR